MAYDEGRFSLGTVFFSFMLGGVVGATLGALLTPRSGPETRERLREQAFFVKDEATKVADEVRDKASELLERSKELVEQKKAILESAVEAGKEAMEKEKERLIAKIKREAEEEAAKEAEGESVSG
ncbi:MAG TPA: YtxH domain-containing protein [Dissulfuribacter thermophilus]|uniref:YtxH domain-containing protein n=1 Tax=Dissulfuribacter thermophilus TaxID=1156395 RepID=A0A7V2SZ31_9BACT|nr:YtxH domain-containing protein [Dissulfuribacter thermophilus]